MPVPCAAKLIVETLGDGGSEALSALIFLHHVFTTLNPLSTDDIAERVVTLLLCLRDKELETDAKFNELGREYPNSTSIMTMYAHVRTSLPDCFPFPVC